MKVRNPDNWLWIAAVLSFAISLTRWGPLVLYPFRMFSTWVHECGHAVMTLLVGGGVSSIVIEPNGAGLTKSLVPQSRIAQGLVASAGYLSASIVGCALMIAARGKKQAHAILWTIGAFMLLTLIISVPAEVLFLNWLHTIWKGSIRLTTPMLFSLGVLFVFGVGGLTGIFLGTISTDLYLHDTMFVVGHFHFTMAAASFLASFAGIYFWFPKMYGRMMNEGLGKLHFWLTFIFFNGTFFPMHIIGVGGHMRRIYNPTQYDFLKPLQHWNVFMTISAICLGTSQIIFLINFFWSMFAGKRASKNPWNANTLEWEAPTPPPHGNFPGALPTVYRGCVSDSKWRKAEVYQCSDGHRLVTFAHVFYASPGRTISRAATTLAKDQDFQQTMAVCGA